jgi:hypothetical protein
MASRSARGKGVYIAGNNHTLIHNLFVVIVGIRRIEGDFLHILF